MFGTSALEDRTAGAQAEFMARVEPLLPIAYRLAHGLLRDAGEAEDAVQDAVLNAWRGRRSFRPGAEVRPWFLAIVANRCRQATRSRWWSVVRLADPEPAAGELDRHSPEDVLLLRAGLGRLSTDDRLVLVLRYYLDLSFDEVAATLRISPPAARVRTHRALRRLRPKVVTPKEFEE
jgi:RNA polymerase sigma-70 factor, ECF subfamily